MELKKLEMFELAILTLQITFANVAQRNLYPS